MMRKNTKIEADLNFLKTKGYSLVKELGRGNFSVVYQMTKENQDYAVKAIKKEIRTEKKKRQDILIKREVRIMKDLQGQKNIMGFYDNFEDQNFYYFVLEIIKGKSLEKKIKEKKEKNTPFEESEIISTAIKIVKGLVHIHKKGIMHRDIKPDNILLDEQDNLIISDFGLAAYCENADLSTIDDEDLISAGSVVGPEKYISLQVLENVNKRIKKKYDVKTDIYSLGVTLFHMMALELPYDIVFDDNNMPRRVLRKGAKIPNNYNQTLLDLTYKMLEDKPEARPTAEESLNILEEIQQGNKKGFIRCRTFKPELIKTSPDSNIPCTPDNTLIYFFLNCISKFKEVNEFFGNPNFSEKYRIIEKNKIPFTSKFYLLMFDFRNYYDNNYLFYKCFSKFIIEASKIIPQFKNIGKIPVDVAIDSIINCFIKDLDVLGLYCSNSLNKFLEEKPQYKNFPLIVQNMNNFNKNYHNIFTNLFSFVTLKSSQCEKCRFENDCEIKNYLYFSRIFEAEDVYSLLKHNHEYNVKDPDEKCKKCGQTGISTYYRFFNSPAYLIIIMDGELLDNPICINKEIDISKFKLSDHGPKQYKEFAKIYKCGDVYSMKEGKPKLIIYQGQNN